MLTTATWVTRLPWKLGCHIFTAAQPATLGVSVFTVATHLLTIVLAVSKSSIEVFCLKCEICRLKYKWHLRKRRPSKQSDSIPGKNGDKSITGYQHGCDSGAQEVPVASVPLTAWDCPRATRARAGTALWNYSLGFATTENKTLEFPGTTYAAFNAAEQH